MRNDQFNGIPSIRSSIKPPRGLFSRIIKRLGLEKQLIIVKKHLGVFAGLLLIFTVWSALAVVGLRAVWRESSLGPLLSLLFSDPTIVLEYWRSFSWSVLEAMPAGALALVLLPLALIIIFARLVSRHTDKLWRLVKAARKLKYHGSK